MAEAYASQIARLNAQVEGLYADVVELRSDRIDVGMRLRAVENSINVMLSAQETSRLREERQYRRLELRLQVLTVVLGAGAVVVPVTLAIGLH